MAFGVILCADGYLGTYRGIQDTEVSGCLRAVSWYYHHLPVVTVRHQRQTVRLRARALAPLVAGSSTISISSITSSGSDSVQFCFATSTTTGHRHRRIPISRQDNRRLEDRIFTSSSKR
eukprot:3623711-Rhodomonas_salina.1